MILNDEEYIDEAIKDGKVCPMVKEEVETNPKIRGAYMIQKTVKLLLKDRFSSKYIPISLFNIISNKISNRDSHH
ncbi:MAG: hypothetical protein FD143_1716 [Ignavibacteria bacterium]|nr:MAG: hypothetical protein FD143_1716 [Ignavibacteria bacterium]KAF0160064.1 MAG: hypothetical protein FD188_1878 [Ignavibacteria bacterium]